jgi:hypothetical protein
MGTPQNENGQKEAEMRTEYKISLTKAASWILLGVGAAALVTSIVYVSSILAFVGLGLTFWGVLLLYVKTQGYTSKVLDASVLPSLYTLSQLVQEFDFKGNPVYLPPKYFEDPEVTKIYIPKQKKAGLPKPEEIQKHESHLFLKNPQGILMTPPGAELTKLFEETLETSFTTVDLEYLQEHLPKLFVEDLEIAEDLEFQRKEDTINAKITNSIYKDLTNLPPVIERIGSPIYSAIACAITKATGKPVTIEKTEVSEDGETIDVKFRIMGMRAPPPTEVVKKIEPAPQTQLEEAVKLYFRSRFLPKMVGLFLTPLGSVILVWVGWLIGYDMIVWDKNIELILFGSRTGEAMSLGIGIKAIHYLVIGLALLLSGLIITLRSKRGE